MNTSRPIFDVALALIGTLLLSGAVTASAAEPAAPSPPSKEMREKMASIHEKMATCLRSDKAFSECRQEMHQQCSNVMGAEGCPMMGMGMGKGRMMPPAQQQQQ